MSYSSQFSSALRALSIASIPVASFTPVDTRSRNLSVLCEAPSPNTIPYPSFSITHYLHTKWNRYVSERVSKSLEHDIFTAFDNMGYRHPQKSITIDRSKLLQGNPLREAYIQQIDSSPSSPLSPLSPLLLSPLPFPACPQSNSSQNGLHLYHIASSITSQGIVRNAIEGKHVLDVGSFRGFGSAYLKTVLGAQSVLGVDISQANTSFAISSFGDIEGLFFKRLDCCGELGSWAREERHKRKGEKKRGEEGRGEERRGEKERNLWEASEVRKESGGFDVAMCVQTYCYVSCSRRMLCDVNVALRPGGELVMFDVFPGTCQDAAVNILERQLGETGFELMRVVDVTEGVMESVRELKAQSNVSLGGIAMLVFARKVQDVVM